MGRVSWVEAQGLIQYSQEGLYVPSGQGMVGNPLGGTGGGSQRQQGP